MTAAALWRRSRPIRGTALVIAAYLVLRLVLVLLAADTGLVSPAGTASAGVLVLGGIVLLLRLVVLFVVPPVLVYRVIQALVRRAAQVGHVAPDPDADRV